MSTLICNDLVINEDSCNLSCRYCLTGQSNLKSGHVDRLIFKPPQRDCSRTGTDLRKRLEAIVTRFAAQFDAPMLKITGGEIYLIDGIEDFIAFCAERFETLLIQTNGVTLSNGQVDQLEALNNVVLQVSVDSHRADGNAYRVAHARQHRKVMERLSRLFARQIDIEVYCVISDLNIEQLGEFAEWLARQPACPQFFMFPVRGPDAEKFAVHSDQIDSLRRFVQDRDLARGVRPPQAYLDRLLRFYVDGERQFRCHLPRLAASTFSDGVLTACPNIWFSDAGNYAGSDWKAVGDRMVNSGVRHALLAPEPRLGACKGCFTPWDILSLFMEGALSLDDICATPAYRAPGVRARLHAARASLINGTDKRENVER